MARGTRSFLIIWLDEHTYFHIYFVHYSTSKHSFIHVLVKNHIKDKNLKVSYTSGRCSRVINTECGAPCGDKTTPTTFATSAFA